MRADVPRRDLTRFARDKYDHFALRFASAFDPVRKAFILCGRDKSGGSQKRFYRQLIDKANTRFDARLAALEAETEKSRLKTAWRRR